VGKKKTQTSSDVSFNEFMKRTYGEGLVVPASALVARPRPILPTALSLDIALAGGIPEGTIVLISGKPKVGKTTLCLHVLANAIQRGRKAAYFDIERRCSRELINTIRGLDREKLDLVKSTKEKIFTAQEWFQNIERFVKSEPGGVGVIDSVAMLSTLAEQTEATGDNTDMSGVPKLMSSFLRKIKDICDINGCILIFITQYQTNRDPASRKKFEEKGGLAVQYACSTWINVDWAKLWDKDTAKQAPLGHDIMCTIRASALGPPYRPCAIPLRYGEAIDAAKDVATHAENLGLIEKAGAWYSIPSLGDVKFQGTEALRKFLLENSEAMACLESQVRTSILGDSGASATTQREDSEVESGEVPAAG
jgi:recombination protein RecA